jgi:hypothetical protein
MEVHAYHRARSSANIANQPSVIKTPIAKTNMSVAGSGSSLWTFIVAERTRPPPHPM